MQDMGRVELEDIYKKLKDSLSKKDKKPNKALLKISNCLKWLSHSQSVSSLQSFDEIFVNR